MQANYQCVIVEIEGTISNRSLYILIDPGDTLSYITSKVVEDCQLAKVRNAKPWSVQLATRARRNVTEFVVDCEVEINNHVIKIDLNVLPLGSYDMIIGMD